MSKFVKRKPIQIRKNGSRDETFVDLKIQNAPVNQISPLNQQPVMMPQAIMNQAKDDLGNVLNMPLTFFYGPNGEPPIIVFPDSQMSTINKEVPDRTHFQLDTRRIPKTTTAQSKYRTRFSSLSRKTNKVQVSKKEIEERIFSQVSDTTSEAQPQSSFPKKNAFLKSQNNLKKLNRT